MEGHFRMKKKWTAIAWTALYMAITFMVQLMLSFAYGMIAFFVAFQSAGRTMDAGAVQEGIQYAMGLLTKGWMMILITLLCDMVLMAGFGTWYYFRERQYPFRPNYKSAFSLKNIGYIIVMGVLGQYASNLIATLTGVLIPSAMDSYEDLAQNFDLSTASPVLMILAVCIVGPIAEELVFRGMIFGKLRRAFSFWPAAIISGIMFGVFHMNIMQGVYASVLGVLLAYVYEKTQTIFGSIFFHIVFNASSYITDFVNSGIQSVVPSETVYSAGLILFSILSGIIVILLARKMKVSVIKFSEN